MGVFFSLEFSSWAIMRRDPADRVNPGAGGVRGGDPRTERLSAAPDRYGSPGLARACQPDPYSLAHCAGAGGDRDGAAGNTYDTNPPARHRRHH